jgi:hypothetical protein
LLFSFLPLAQLGHGSEKPLGVLHGPALPASQESKACLDKSFVWDVRWMEPIRQHQEPPALPEDTGKPPQNFRNRPPEVPISLDFSRGKSIRTDPEGGGPPGGPPGVIMISPKSVFCGVAQCIPPAVCFETHATSVDSFSDSFTRK